MNKLKIVSICFVLYVPLYFILVNDKLPDYHAYLDIFLKPESYSSWNIAFTTLSLISLQLMTYDSFRFVIFLLGLLLVVIATKPRSAINNYILIFCIFVFLLEFYIIRLRAGVCIFIFYLALLLYEKRYRLLFITFLSGAFLLHPASALTLTLVYAPFFLKVKRNRFFLCGLLCAWMLLFLFIDELSILRGSHLNSVINPARIAFLVLLPLIFYTILTRLKFNLPKLLREPELAAVFTGSIGLLFLYLIGTFQTSGEAIVRVYSLLVGPAVTFAYLNRSAFWSNATRRYARVVMLMNSLFFLNTVYL